MAITDADIRRFGVLRWNRDYLPRRRWTFARHGRAAAERQRLRSARDTPILGRDFVAADEKAGAPPVAILNYRFWESRFNKRADIVGLTVHINGAPATIIGVMPEGFVLVYEQNLWMPLVHTPDVYRRDFEGGVLGGYATARR